MYSLFTVCILRKRRMKIEKIGSDEICCAIPIHKWLVDPVLVDVRAEKWVRTLNNLSILSRFALWCSTDGVVHQRRLTDISPICYYSFEFLSFFCFFLNFPNPKTLLMNYPPSHVIPIQARWCRKSILTTLCRLIRAFYWNFFHSMWKEESVFNSVLLFIFEA